MSKKIKTFEMFGTEYKTEQFSAVQGLEMINVDEIHPIDLLSKTQAKGDDGIWRSLDHRSAINDLVMDKANVLAPRLVLSGLQSVVHEFNFGFLRGWRSAKVPSRFTAGTKMVKSDNIDPMTSQLIQDGISTLKELEDYYSLQDAFKMFDTMMVKGINAALSNEASIKNSKRNK